MKLREIFRFELRYQARRPTTWLVFAVLVGISFLMTRNGALAEALYDDFFLNSPFAIAKTTVVGSLVWLLVAAAVAGEAGARDVATGMHPLAWTTPVRKGEYLGGRFLAALVLNAVLLLAVQAGILLGVYLPGVEGDLIGPFRPEAYLTAWGYVALPTAFAATALQFALAARSGRSVAAYGGSLILFSMAYVVGLFLLMRGRQDLARLLDPVGVHFILSDLSYLWTTYEKSWRLLSLEGAVLINRLLWLGFGGAALAGTWAGFRFAHPAESARRWGRRARHREAHAPTPGGLAVPAGRPAALPRAPRTFGLGVQIRCTLAAARASFRAVARSWGGIVLLVAIPLVAVLVVLDQMSLYGIPMIPSTGRVLAELTAPVSAELSRWVIVPLLLVFFAGELVWREREAGVDELVDATPIPEWVPLLGRLLGLGLVLALFLALLAAAGIAAQAILGHRDFQLGLYLGVLFGLQLPDYLLFAVLAVAVHVFVDHKHVGHLVAILAWCWVALTSLFGLEHKLLVYGAAPAWSWSEMRGFGPSLAPWIWFKLYWAAWALALVVAARLLHVRGKENAPRTRLRLARGRLTPATARALAVAAALVLGLGGFVFYNTNVRNDYRPASEQAALQAEYERRYKRFQRIPQPELAAIRLRLEIHPEEGEAVVRGSYDLRNRTAAPIDSLHLSTVPGREPEALSLDRPAALVLADEERGYRIYALERPLEPGEALSLDFEARIGARGFGNGGADASVVENGTYFTSASAFPALGYQPLRELVQPRDRREHGLPERPVIPSLYDEVARMDRMQGGGPYVFEAVIGTAEDQVAVAPGRLRRTWTEGGRRYFHYATDDAFGTELGHGFFSARYAVYEAAWNDVAIQVFHHPAHTDHLERMVRSIRASLDVYAREFGPYERDYLTVVERPGAGVGMHADAGIVIHEEGFAAWRPRNDGQGLDMPFAIVAHEMGHQWTVPYAFVEGAPVMSESLAWYYAMQVIREHEGEGQLRRLRSFMRQPYPYPPIRRGEPLLRGLDPWMSYRKGPYALHALSRYVGTDPVNAALRRLWEEHRDGVPPLATTLDLYGSSRPSRPIRWRICSTTSSR